MREAKRDKDRVAAAKKAALTGGLNTALADGKSSIANDIIAGILESDDASAFTLGPMDPAEEKKQSEAAKDKAELLVAPYVVEIEIKPVVSQLLTILIDLIIGESYYL